MLVQFLQLVWRLVVLLILWVLIGLIRCGLFFVISESSG
jgi:hypothetical protein